MRKAILLISLICLLSPAWASGTGEQITSAGKRLDQVLSDMDVSHLWQAEHYVDWETGKIIHPEDTKKHAFSSHCSAFVSAVCVKLDIPILRPLRHGESAKSAPAGLIHSEVHLASAQYDWLEKEGKQYGWELVKNPIDAQQFANEGKLVVVVVKSKEAAKPGHIAIVRPWERSKTQLQEDGPEIIQAGKTNFEHTSVREGFKRHEGAWPNLVRFYVHPLKK